MNRPFVAVAGLVMALVLGACGRQEPVAAPVEPTPQQAAERAAEEAADGAVAAESCTQNCGDGLIATIQCAAGETAVCDCDEEPKARCEVPAPEATQPPAAGSASEQATETTPAP